MNDSPNVNSLLTEIRDLLIPISHAYREKYADYLLRRQMQTLLAAKVTGQKNRAACVMMDGSNGQSAIAKATSVDPGNLSKLVKALKENGLLIEESPPRLVLSVHEVNEAFA